MNLSMKFLQIYLSDYDVSIELNQCSNPFFESVQVWSPYKELTANTLYFCLSDTTVKDLNLEKQIIPENVGLIWLNPNEMPHVIPVMIPDLISPEVDSWLFFNSVIDVFNYMNGWAGQLHTKILQKASLTEIFNLLNQVTPNPWYMCDSSFRVHPMKKDPVLAEMSIFWKRKMEHNYLPLETVIAMEESGELAYINSQERAVIVDTKVFYNPYVSKTLFSENGILSHFFITSGSRKVNEVDREIAEYFGNVINDLFIHNTVYLPTRGRYYDNFFIDLIESKLERAPAVIEQVFHKLKWNDSDQFVVFVRKSETCEESVVINTLELQILEQMFPCQAFIYKDYVVGVFNLSQRHILADESFHAAIRRDIESIRNNIGGVIGVSDPFHANAGFINLSDFYHQAAASIEKLDFTKIQGESNHIHFYKDKAVSYICHTLEQEKKRWAFYHPGVQILMKYDEENDTELCSTLQNYLMNGQNAMQTAKQMFIHRNTLLYRLERIIMLTGIDLSNPNECIRLIMSLSYTRGAVDREKN